MIIQREINGVELDVDVSEGNEVYLPESVAHKIKDFGIGGVVNAIYDASEKEHSTISVFIELTDKCNFSCPFCYINEAGICHSELPRFGMLKGTLDFLIDNGMLYCTLSGGECLMHPDFMQIYGYLKKRGVLVTVFTNGYLIDDAILTLFSEYKPFKVEVSLYGMDDSSYRVATRNNSAYASRVFDNVLKLTSLGIEVVCKTPVTSLTEQSVDKIEAWCNDHKISFNSDYELQASYSGVARKNYLASEGRIDAMKEKSDREFYSDPKMMDLANRVPRKMKNFDCAAGRTEVFITSKYQLVPCMKAIGIEGWSFDIQENGIESAYEALVSKIKAIKNTPLTWCLGCSHYEICQECFFTQYYFEDIKAHRESYCKWLDAFCSNSSM